MSTFDSTYLDRRDGLAWPLTRTEVVLGLLAAVLAGGVTLRFIAAGPLWFDEMQSLGIARLPLASLFDALRQDGSPPLYYLVLHAWIGVFGTSTAALRALSGLGSVASLPVVWLLARRLLSRQAAAFALVLVASSPMAIRYALEVRMYAFEPLLVALGGLALLNVLERPAWPRVALLALASGALALTHYWALFLLAAVGLGLLPGAVRGARGQRAAILGLLAGGLVFAPWLPSMLFQIRHTGTPWSHAALYEVLEALPAWGGASEVTPNYILPSAALLVPLLVGLVVFGVVRVPRSRPLAGIAFGTLLVAGIASVVIHSAVVPRYMSVALLPYLLAAAAGLAAVPRSWRSVLVAAVAVLGLVTGWFSGVAPRTIAGDVASMLKVYGRPDDVVVYCPDQLGPDVSRLLPSWPRQQVFPTGGRPDRVNWVDYAQRNRRSQPLPFARQAVAGAGRSSVWLLQSDDFEEYAGRCGQLAASLDRLRPLHRLRLTGLNPMDITQQETLVEYLPPPAQLRAAGP